MKKIITAACTLMMILAGCDAGFDEINTSKTGIPAINPAYVLNNAMIRSSFPQQTLAYELAIVQQMVTPNSGVVAGGNYNQDNRSVTPLLWQRYYREVMRSLVDVINKTAEDNTRTNLYNMTRIWRAFAMMVLTDSYGEVPMLDAGKGYLSTIVTPEYETQEAIYIFILAELQEASAALDASKAIETSDIMYMGNIAKWKKLGYSLLLRAAMRHSKVNPQRAQQYVTVAVNGGLMQANADNAVIRHNANYANEVSTWLTSTEAANFYLARPFLNFLKTSNDPRLVSIAVRYVGAGSGTHQADAIAGKESPAVISRNAVQQIGMPMGYNNTSIKAAYEADGLKSFYDYSQLDRTRMGKTSAPMFLVTYAQTSLLLAEAVSRGWAAGTISTLYEEGIRGHMRQMADYDANSAITETAINQYITDHPFVPGATELEQINNQYWVASFLNGPEAFANFRRSGFPALTPNPYPDKTISGNFITRLTYPDTEFSSNAVNIQKALERQGKDNMDTKIWWDKN